MTKILNNKLFWNITASTIMALCFIFCCIIDFIGLITPEQLIAYIFLLVELIGAFILVYFGDMWGLNE